MSKNQKGKFKNIPDDLLEEYQEIFDSYDVNGNGVIDKKEMETILQKLGQPATSKQIEKVFNELGNSKSQLTFEEFIEFIKKYHLSKNKNSTDEVIGAFQVFDRNHNGVLSLSEFKHILNKVLLFISLTFLFISSLPCEKYFTVARIITINIVILKKYFITSFTLTTAMFIIKNFSFVHILLTSIFMNKGDYE